MTVLEDALIAPDVATFRAMVARALGRAHDPGAIALLEGVRDDTTEPDFVRGAADQAVNQIDRILLSP